MNSLKDLKNNTDIICAANAICHVPDLTDLIKGIDLLLNKNGFFIFEEPDLGSMFNKISYDIHHNEKIKVYLFKLLFLGLVHS